MNILKNSMILHIVLSSDELVWHNHQRKSRVLAIWSLQIDVTQSTYVIMHFAFPNGLLFREIDCLKYGRFRPFADSLCIDKTKQNKTFTYCPPSSGVDPACFTPSPCPTFGLVCLLSETVYSSRRSDCSVVSTWNACSWILLVFHSSCCRSSSVVGPRCCLLVVGCPVGRCR